MFRQRPSLNPRLKGFARDLRRRATIHEARLWALLRVRRFVDFKFRRQVAIGPCVADFICYEAKLILELDGSQHADSTHELARDTELQRRGFRVLRIWNGDLARDRIGVLTGILDALHEATGND